MNVAGRVSGTRHRRRCSLAVPWEGRGCLSDGTRLRPALRPAAAQRRELHVDAADVCCSRLLQLMQRATLACMLSFPPPATKKVKLDPHAGA